MQNVILGLLLAGPLSLYDVRKHITSVISLFYSASFGSIQHSLGALVARGLATVTEVTGDTRGRKMYTITAEGRTAWTAWMQEPLTGADPEKTMLARVFFLDRMPTAALRRQVLAVIAERIDADAEGLRRLDAALRRRDAEPGAAASATASSRATLDYGIRSHALAQQWIAELQAKEVG